ncbi:methyltransferase family protein [Tamaricihabitans halophyticus]|uniref:Methyltransferase family protein n=1 Tax=Tamaricihabitans halophyticus TaxID=1262583 RepID=A0A4R2PYI4_9PSEU|nr:class I SAM-dependent methyltransferase [Tamaricihabitans halophyticus]TCP41220.1 methyltransferase family protein [Tamaricihabitans halophyticus]
MLIQTNARLAEMVPDLPTGDVLDLGCGDGGDAIWLASRGWMVTAIDISATAVQRLDYLANVRGLDDRITATVHDLQTSFPSGMFDLVNAHYLRTPFALDRAQLLRTAAHALVPGGRLLVVDHGSAAPWSWNRDSNVRYPGPHEIYAELDLDPLVWSAETTATLQRTATGPGGQTAQVTDHVLLVRRTTGP